MQTKKCCADCAYGLAPTSHWLRIVLAHYFPGLMLCFNHPDCPGQMAETVPHHPACRSFRERSHYGERNPALRPNKEGICYIPLTRNQVAMVDAEDFDELKKYRWYAVKRPNTWYAARGGGGRNLVLMHRQLMNPPEDKVVDHWDGNGLNNCKSNLRICDREQNNYNSRPKGDTCCFKGVSRVRRHDKFRAVIGYKGDLIEIGEFVDPVDAARARDMVARELQGAFAWLNLPQEILVRRPPGQGAGVSAEGHSIETPVSEEVLCAVESALIRAWRKHPRRCLELSGRAECHCHAGANLTVIHGPCHGRAEREYGGVPRLLTGLSRPG